MNQHSEYFTYSIPISKLFYKKPPTNDPRICFTFQLICATGEYCTAIYVKSWLIHWVFFFRIPQEHKGKDTIESRLEGYLLVASTSWCSLIQIDFEGLPQDVPGGRCPNHQQYHQTYDSYNSMKDLFLEPLHPWRLTAGTCPHGGLVQIIFLSKWVMAVGSMNFLLIFQGVHSSNLRVERKFFSTEVKLVGTCFLHITLHPNLGRISSTSFRFLPTYQPGKTVSASNQPRSSSIPTTEAHHFCCLWCQVPMVPSNSHLSSPPRTGRRSKVNPDKLFGGGGIFLQNPLSEFGFGPATLVKLPRLP